MSVSKYWCVILGDTYQLRTDIVGATIKVERSKDCCESIGVGFSSGNNYWWCDSNSGALLFSGAYYIGGCLSIGAAIRMGVGIRSGYLESYSPRFSFQKKIKNSRKESLHPRQTKYWADPFQG